MMKSNVSVQSKKALQSTILILAARIGGGWDAARGWFEEDEITSLDGLTAAELVVADRGHQVLEFLLRVSADEALTASESIRI